MALLASALYDNEAEVHDELSFKRGEQLVVLDTAPAELDGWWICRCQGRTGLAPANRLKLIGKLSDQVGLSGTNLAAQQQPPSYLPQAIMGMYQVPPTSAGIYEYPVDRGSPEDAVPSSYEHYQVPTDHSDLDSNRSSGISVASHTLSNQGETDNSKDSAVEDCYDNFTLRTVPLRVATGTGATSAHSVLPLTQESRTPTPPRSAKSVTFAGGRSGAGAQDDHMMKSMTPFDFYDIPNRYAAAAAAEAPADDDTGIYDIPMYLHSPGAATTVTSTSTGSVTTPLATSSTCSSRESVRTPVQEASPPPHSPAVELHSRTEALQKFTACNNGYIAATDRLYLFIHAKWKEEPSLTLNMLSIRETCQKLLYNSRDFLQFCQSVQINAKKTKDNALTKKLSQHTALLERLHGQLEHTVHYQLNQHLKWSPKGISASAQRPDGDHLGVLVATVRDATIEMRVLWNTIQGNVNILFPHNDRQTELRVPQLPNNHNNNNNVAHIWKYYATQVLSEKAILDTAVADFHHSIQQKQPPSVFVAHCKNVILHAQAVVRSAECLQKGLQSEKSAADHEVEMARDLCDLLKGVIEAAKLASEQYPSEEPQRRMAQQVTEVAGQAEKLKLSMKRKSEMLQV